MPSHSSKKHKNHHGYLAQSGGSYSASESDLSSSSGASSYRHSMDSQRPVVSVEVLRCLRCARAVEATSTDDASASGMVRVGHNIYYCHRCAKLVGYK
jgi:hypothetical protein